MKLNIEMTEAEVLGFYKLLEGSLQDVQVAVSREEVRAAQPPAPAAPEAPKATITEADLKLVEKGRVLFTDLVHKWLVNFGLEGAEQPDRIAVLRDVASGPEATAVLWYVASVGGVIHAVDAAAGPKTSPYPLTPEAEEGHRNTVRDVAANITQISSLYFHDLCALYEHRDIYKEK